MPLLGRDRGLGSYKGGGGLFWLLMAAVAAMVLIMIHSSGASIHTLPSVKLSPIASSSGIEFFPSSCSSITTQKFDDIYRAGGTWGPKIHEPEYFYGDAQWPPVARESSSGWGSDLGPGTSLSLQILKETISKYNITSMIDVPCGDVNWIFDSFLTDALPLYLGLDISSLAVRANDKRFSHHVNKYFSQWDAVACALPKFRHAQAPNEEWKHFELVHARAVIQHLPLESGMKYICNVFNSGARIFVGTAFPGVAKNENVQVGKFYRNNFFIEPFNFPEDERESCTTRCHVGNNLCFTCVFDLSKKWVKEWVADHCGDYEFDIGKVLS